MLVMPPSFREALELAGVRPERVQADLAAKERAKQARLYSVHGASVAHSSSSGRSSSGNGGSAGVAAQQREAAGGPLYGSSGATNSKEAATESTTEPATPTATAALGPAVEPERGSAEWLAAQQAYEDAHLGQFERVMPPSDPQLVCWAGRVQCVLAMAAWSGARMLGAFGAQPVTVMEMQST